MNTGYKIRYIRKNRGLTQKALGKKMVFDERAADIRVAQYESGVRKPKSELLLKIADALSVRQEFLLPYPTESAMNIIAFLAEAITQGYLVPRTLVEEDGTVRNVLCSASTDISQFICYAATIAGKGENDIFDLLVEWNYPKKE